MKKQTLIRSICFVLVFGVLSFLGVGPAYSAYRFSDDDDECTIAAGNGQAQDLTIHVNHVHKKQHYFRAHRRRTQFFDKPAGTNYEQLSVFDVTVSVHGEVYGQTPPRPYYYTFLFRSTLF